MYLIVLLTLFLQGCALKQYETVYETKEVGREKYLNDDGGRKIQSLSAANINPNGVLTITGFTFTELTEYEGPKMNDITRVSRPADPIGALTNTALTLGLNVLLAPKRTGGQLVGDTASETVTKSYVDKSRGVSTGAKTWQKDQSNFSTQILVDGILDRVISFNYSGSPIDLSKYFQESSLNGIIPIKVTCQTCGQISRTQTQDFILFQPSKTVEFDLGAFKQNIQQKKLQAEKEEQKRVADLKSSATAGQQKCLRMGLKVGTEDYNLCIASQK
jgi:hypothetical protein